MTKSGTQARAYARNGTAYELTGPAGRPVVVLVHGLGMTRGMWDDYVPALAGDYRVLRYDLFGHGASAMPPETPTLAVYAGQLKELLDEVSIDRVGIIGFSLGGMINRRFCMDHPARVTALAVLNSPHERSREEQRTVEIRAEKSLADGPASTLDEAIARWFTPEFIAARPDEILEVRTVIMANDPLAYGHCRAVLAKGVVELIRPAPPIACPALIMTCENDGGSTPHMSHAMAAEISGAQTLIVPHLRHCGLLERPALFIGPLLRFFTSISYE